MTAKKTTTRRLVLERNGAIVRSFAWNGEDAQLVQRLDTRRVEIHSNLAELEQKKIRFEALAAVSEANLRSGQVAVGATGVLRLVVDATDSLGAVPVAKNVTLERDSNRNYTRILAGFLVFGLVSLISMRSINTDTPALEKELKQQVVQIIKNIPRPQQQRVANVTNRVETQQVVKSQTRQQGIKRMGALAVFGSMNNSNQRGGVNLGAVNTTAGPGLGGTGGSGGIQTSLYGKGLVAAPVGPGANMQGGGGYGTKGKGGGQAGYGKIALIGSAGSNPIPLGREAIIGGGLDRELIDDVIRRNLGQVRFCYEQALQGDPSLAGRVAVGFTIGGNGQVKTASVENTTLNSRLVEDCILLRLKTWKFPLPEGGLDVKVSYPFVLRRTGQG
jgi:hypothetical protein